MTGWTGAEIVGLMGQEWQVCQVTVGVLGDVCRALDDQMMPFCADLLPILLQNLQSNDVHRNVKPGILSCFGDIVLAVGDKFEVSCAHTISRRMSALISSIFLAGMTDCIFKSLLDMSTVDMIILVSALLKAVCIFSSASSSYQSVCCGHHMPCTRLSDLGFSFCRCIDCVLIAFM